MLFERTLEVYQVNKMNEIVNKNPKMVFCTIGDSKVDLTKFKDPVITKAYFDSMKVNWNENHKLKIGEQYIEVYIQDKNGCGISSIEVSVIGFPKFFTPNSYLCVMAKDGYSYPYAEFSDINNVYRLLMAKWGPVASEYKPTAESISEAWIRRWNKSSFSI